MGLEPRALAQMDRVDSMVTILERLQKIPNRNESLGMSSALGGDQFQNVLKLKDVRDAMREASEVGAVFTQEQQEQVRVISRAWTQASAAIRSVAIEIGMSLVGEAGAVQEVGSIFVRNARFVAEWVKEHREVIRIALAIAAGLGVAGMTILTLGAVFKTAGMGIGIVISIIKTLAAVVGFLLSPLGLATAAIVLLLTQTQTGRETISKFGEAMNTAFSTFTDGWGGIVNAVKAGKLELAFEIAAEGVKAIWYGMIIDLGKAFSQFIAENRSKLVALGAIIGAQKGMSIGRMLGPKGAAAGLLIGGVTGGVGADAALDEIMAMSINPALEAKRQAALIEMRRLTKKAAEEAAKVEAPRTPEDYKGGGGPQYNWRDAQKAAGAFQSRDFSRLFSTGSIADKQLAAAMNQIGILKEQLKTQNKSAEELQRIERRLRDLVESLSFS
jgi:hypothetical protein